MKVRVLGIDIAVPKLYLECGHCQAPGLSVTKVLTGLSNGDASTELKLMVAYSAAEHSYGKASRDHQAHHGQDVERTTVRRIALEVEALAMAFAEQQRVEATERVSAEAKTIGVEQLMMQGDGGSVRTGELVPCEEGDEGYGKKTPNSSRALAASAFATAQRFARQAVQTLGERGLRAYIEQGVLASLAVGHAASGASAAAGRATTRPTGNRTTAASGRGEALRPKMSRNDSGLFAKPACIAGVLQTLPNLRAKCGRTKL